MLYLWLYINNAPFPACCKKNQDGWVKSDRLLLFQVDRTPENPENSLFSITCSVCLPCVAWERFQTHPTPIVTRIGWRGYREGQIKQAKCFQSYKITPVWWAVSGLRVRTGFGQLLARRMVACPIRTKQVETGCNLPGTVRVRAALVCGTILFIILSHLSHILLSTSGTCAVFCEG